MIFSPYRSVCVEHLPFDAWPQTGHESAQLVYDLAKFEDSGFAEYPARRAQRSACKSLTASGRVADRDAVGTGIEANLVGAWMGTSAIRAQIDGAFKTGLLHSSATASSVPEGASRFPP